MYRHQIVEYYNRDDIARAIAEAALGREAAGVFSDGTYDSRPNAIFYPNDVKQMAKKGVTSFHISVEHWKNPMALSTEQKNYSELRTGYDILIDIDSKLGIEEAKLTAKLICEFLEKYSIKNYGIKFSGRRGFHIVLPWIMFPKEIDFKATAKQYPKIPKIIARFIRRGISEQLMRELIKAKGAKQLIDILEEKPSKLSPYFFVEVEKDWGARHLFRAPYSLNEKTWLVSMPIKSSDLMNFNPDVAKPEKVEIKASFFQGEENEAESLLLDAMDWYATVRKDYVKKELPQRKLVWEKRIPEELFPPCMKLILAGMSDGRKRSMFTLINFLRMCNWPWNEIEEKLFEWNSRNKPPLPKTSIISQLRYSQNNSFNPANCDSDMFYDDIGICRPDITCKGGTEHITVKNPINYPFRKMRREGRTRKPYISYKCAVCNRGFKSMHSLSIHKARAHQIYETI